MCMSAIKNNDTRVVHTLQCYAANKLACLGNCYFSFDRTMPNNMC